jgi:hypothetical protein
VHSRSPRLRVHHYLFTCLICCTCHRASQRSTSVMSSSTVSWGRIVASPSSATMKGATTSRVTTSSEILNLLRLHEKHLPRVSCIPLAPQQALGGVWCSHHISRWWSGRASCPICRRSTMGQLIPLSSYISTPPPFSLQGEMKSSWPTIFQSP